ncbi:MULTISPECIES: efflux RND transporter periplasmic adaptor subunit [Mucilaginibacter]|jgi:HlyD family secretion protein|uniref:Efflux RND transporter periplasmic adaptor subunit n=1 Tax=Mucilaginibacter rubeus TaxID=2027860 RepID=A0AAE6JLH3_9SPHI|nr:MULTISPECIES: efflux RND transporter periplasmic adaptor subunit [Mucilaginibacter]NVM63997.1 HlyD family secretion protein [Mucilaginibacter sp. SG538B]QEM07531.1 efflux RND transporter periplasmic adaptor subunit [Mucilaginibacter rubeus]QEM19985.1 efflux RND transporter periplasmic adaptor subunit [Mucilaginibacter gossypii]QTE34998.1 efflux RND transporter periplasmic adaptor subunit [Mucilaginibacter gossypii]QTE43307.1 efflux RND transporter periplasmic adaptor subunit [Mucilaginibact
MGKTTKYILIGLGALIVLLIIAKVTGLIGKPALTQVATEKAETREINETVSASGKIKPHVEVKISPEVSGEVVELPIKEGDVVKKGQLLCKIRPDILKSGYDRAIASYNTQKASVGNSSQMLKQAEATYANQAGIYKRSKELYDKKVLTVSEFENAKAAYEGAKASLEAAKQNVVGSQYGLAQSQASVKEAQDNLAKTTIYSPVDGVVSKLSVEKGERVLGTQQFAGTEIMTISDLSKMDVNVDVNENDINRISLGDSSKIEVDAFLGKKFTGVVTEIGSSANVVGTSADQVTNFTVKVRINADSYAALLKKTADNPSPFRPGLTATVDISTNSAKALSVPIQSVTTREEKKENNGPPKADEDKSKPQISPVAKEYVFVLNAGKLKQVQVTTGIQNDSYIQILSGLKGGEEVVSAPYSAISKTLSDGQAVQKVDKSKLFNADNTK